MAKKKAIDPKERISDWLASHKLKDLKRAAIMRGYPFILVGETDINGLQSWLLRHYDDPLDHKKLEEFDVWREDHLRKQGYIDEPIHVGLKLGFYRVDEDGNEIHERRNALLMGVTKSNSEVASFKPRKGSMKTRVFELIYDDKGTKDIIKIMNKEFPEASDGSIKVWCSQARKVKKAKEAENE